MWLIVSPIYHRVLETPTTTQRQIIASDYYFQNMYSVLKYGKDQNSIVIKINCSSNNLRFWNIQLLALVWPKLSPRDDLFLSWPQKFKTEVSKKNSIRRMGQLKSIRFMWATHAYIYGNNHGCFSVLCRYGSSYRTDVPMVNAKLKEDFFHVKKSGIAARVWKYTKKDAVD